MTPEEEKRRLAWQCRRGMLELDELLLRFVDDHYADLGAGERESFQALLREPDPQLFHWLFQAPEAAPERYRALIERLTAASRLL